MPFENLFVCHCGETHLILSFKKMCATTCRRCDSVISPTPWVPKEQALNRLHAGVWKAMRSDSSVLTWFIVDGVRVFKTPKGKISNSGDIGFDKFYEVDDDL